MREREESVVNKLHSFPQAPLAFSDCKFATVSASGASFINKEVGMSKWEVGRFLTHLIITGLMTM